MCGFYFIYLFIYLFFLLIKLIAFEKLQQKFVFSQLAAFEHFINNQVYNKILERVEKRRRSIH